MLEAFLYSEAVTSEDIKKLICRAVCRDEDDDTSERLVRGLVECLYAISEIEDCDARYATCTGEEAYKLYYKVYFRTLHKRDPEDADYGDLCPPDHATWVGVPRFAVIAAARADAQRARAFYRHMRNIEQQA